MIGPTEERNVAAPACEKELRTEQTLGWVTDYRGTNRSHAEDGFAVLNDKQYMRRSKKVTS